MLLILILLKPTRLPSAFSSFSHPQRGRYFRIRSRPSSDVISVAKRKFGSCNSNWILFFVGFGKILSLCGESIGWLHMVGLWNGTVWLVHVQELYVCLGVGSNPRLFKSVVNLHCSVDLGGIGGFHAFHRTDFFIYFYLFHHPFYLLPRNRSNLANIQAFHSVGSVYMGSG